MTSPPRDLWPDLPPEIDTGPWSILREQGEALTRKTGGRLQGRVYRYARGDQFYLSFRIVIPNLDGDYEYELFHLHHGAEMYPVIVDSSPKAPEDPWPITDSRGQPRLISEADFVCWLTEVLRSDHTQRVIGTLLAQSNLDVAS
jgi:hypothetical protein